MPQSPIEAALRRVVRASRRARTWSRVGGEFDRDAARYRAHAARGGDAAARLTDVQLEAQVTKDYHRIEKGLSLSSPKRPFGADVQRRLGEHLELASVRAPGAEHVVAAQRAMQALSTWNDGGPADAEVAPESAGPAAGPRIPDAAGFFASRHSVRAFSDEAVSDEELDAAVQMAGRAPSVCNRQPWAVGLYRGDEARAVLAHQNGNRGFGDEIPVLALVTVELGHFAGAGERNQAWIEGGIFASTFVWALHAVGLESCMLNLSLTSDAADGLRRTAGLRDSEVPIMAIAIGHALPAARVAASSRRTVTDLVRHRSPHDR